MTTAASVASQQPRDHIHLHVALGQQALELGVLARQRVRPLRLRHAHAPKLFAPVREDRGGDSVCVAVLTHGLLVRLDPPAVSRASARW
jgi:hypothetical protein